MLKRLVQSLVIGALVVFGAIALSTHAQAQMSGPARSGAGAPDAGGMRSRIRMDGGMHMGGVHRDGGMHGGPGHMDGGMHRGGM